MVHRVLSRLNKEDIGMPTNFQHISHVGWDPNHGFDLENVDPNLKKFFQKAGVDEKALQDTYQVVAKGMKLAPSDRYGKRSKSVLKHLNRF